MIQHKNSNNCSNKSNSTNGVSNEMYSKREYTIDARISTIKDIFKTNNLQPIVNFDLTETAQFVGSKDEKSTKDRLNKKTYDNFKDIICNQIGGKLRYVTSGTTGHTFKGEGKKNGVDIEFAVKVVAYPIKSKLGSITNITRPENAELLMIKILSKFVINKETPHIALPIFTFDTNIEHFTNLISNGYIREKEDKKRYLKFVQAYEKKSFHDQVSVLVSEWANRGDLMHFLQANYDRVPPMFWKVIFFQIISVLAVIQSKWPGFRHNDLKANNILLHKTDKCDGVSNYKVLRKNYIIPNIGYHIKLWDFDFACIPGIVDNIKVSSDWARDDINVTPTKYQYYDLHFFFNTLTCENFIPQIMTSSVVPNETKNFIRRVVPDKYKYGDNIIDGKARIKIYVEHTTPADLLANDEYFAEFRVDPNKIANNKSLNSINITKFLETPSKSSVITEEIKIKKPRNKKNDLIQDIIKDINADDLIKKLR